MPKSGTSVDPIARVADGYATIRTNGGHDNTLNKLPSAGASSSFSIKDTLRWQTHYSGSGDINVATNFTCQ